MQGFSSKTPETPVWTEPEGTLGQLTREAHARAMAVADRLEALKAVARDARPVVPFRQALTGPHLRVIAEVKRASPSKGTIAPGLDAVGQAEAYVRGGAAAISVLTEPTRFGGSLEDLQAVAAAVQVPVIRKDFLVHPVQLWEARAAGASAALLIVRSLAPSLLPLLIDTAREIGLEPLVEIRDLVELERALAAGASVIGVNNRNLESLVIDTATAPAIIPHIPSDRVAVAESGMQQPDDLHAPRDAGADAVLVGSAVSTATDPEAQVRALAAIARHATARR